MHCSASGTRTRTDLLIFQPEPGGVRREHEAVEKKEACDGAVTGSVVK